MTKNLVAENGTVVHANAEGNALCAPNMRRNGFSNRFETVSFAEVDAAVTCKACCAKLGITAPKTSARRPARKATRPAYVATQADIEASRQGMIEWAETEVRFEGGTVMDTLHASALVSASYRKGRR